METFEEISENSVDLKFKETFFTSHLRRNDKSRDSSRYRSTRIQKIISPKNSNLPTKPFFPTSGESHVIGSSFGDSK